MSGSRLTSLYFCAGKKGRAGALYEDDGAVDSNGSDAGASDGDVTGRSGACSGAGAPAVFVRCVPGLGSYRCRPRPDIV
jgi:hypothetical protein